MAIITTVSVSDFRDAFRAMGRHDQFSYDALGALFDYYDELSEDTGEPWELDVIAICCDWEEYNSALEAANEYRNIWTPPERDEDTDDETYADELEESALDFLRDNTTVLELDSGGVVVLSF